MSKELKSEFSQLLETQDSMFWGTIVMTKKEPSHFK